MLPLSPSRIPRAQAHSPTRSSVLHLGGPLTGGMRKFVDRMPGLGPAGANNLRASTSRLLFPIPRPIRAPTTTKSPWSSIPRRCTRTCRRPNSGATCSLKRREHWRQLPLKGLPPSKHISRGQRALCYRQSPLPGAYHRCKGESTRHSRTRIPTGPGRSDAGSRQVLQPASHRHRRRPLHSGGRNRSGCRARAGTAGYGGRNVHTKPGHHPPPRQQHRLDQRRQCSPVDYARQTKAPPTPRASACGTCRI